MEFKQENYNAINDALEQKQEIEFYAPKLSTCFADTQAPDDWQLYPPLVMPESEYFRIYHQASDDIRGALIRLGLRVHLEGGKVFYKMKDKDFVSIKVTFAR